MSLARVEEEIAQFLLSDAPQSLCIVGRWGVGKTYVWQQALARAVADDRMNGDHSYVSLFGIDSLAALKQAIVENTKDNKSSNPATFESYIEHIQNKIPSASKLFRKIMPWSKYIPTYGEFVQGIASAGLFLTVRKQVICFDDMERANGSLAVADVLGLGLQLKEERNCRVVFLLNDDALGERGEIFRAFAEKAFDRVIRFSPTPQESARIVFKDEDRLSMWVVDRCVSLGIDNIRTIRRIRADALRLIHTMKDRDEDLREEAIHTLCLATWSILEPGQAPSISFIERHASGEFAFSDLSLTPEEKAWQDQLNNYRFFEMTDLDRLIIRGSQSGYFDYEEISRISEGMSTNKFRKRMRARYNDERMNFHFNFIDSDEKIIDDLLAAFYACIEGLNLDDVSHIYETLVEADREEEAQAAVDKFFDVHADEESSFYDASSISYSARELAPPVKERADAHFKKSDPAETLSSVLLRISGSSGWGGSDEEAMARASVGDYVSAFTCTTGAELRNILIGARHFMNVGNLSKRQATINETVRAALVQLGKRSRLSAERVSRYGAGQDDQPDDDAPA